jgi:ribonuclease HI
MIIVHTDGSCEPSNPNGVGTWGVVIRDDKGKLILMGSGVIGEGKGQTNQVAEYYAVVVALSDLLDKKLQDEDAILYSDSDMLVGQMMGHKRANRGEYLPFFFQAKKLAESLPKLKFQWIPRLENKEADQLTRDAYEAYCKVNGIKVKYGRRR